MESLGSTAPIRSPWKPITTTADAFRFVHSESIEEINQRAAELEQLLDQGLAVGLAELLKMEESLLNGAATGA
jgi:hypothetical protein